MKIFTILLVLTILKYSYTYCSASREPIVGLEPRNLWESFYNISCIPRCSTKEITVRQNVVEFFARSRGYQFQVDQKGNIVVKVPATAGREGKPTVVLQTHMDMVCEKNEGINHDFDKDPIQFVKQGDWISAKGTTLGSDDAIGMAHVLAMLLEPNRVHGPLELLFTVEEEIGLLGALALKPGFINGKLLINIDDVTQGQVTVGCAGGQTTTSTFPAVFERDVSGNVVFMFKVYGGAGGHSGVDIDKKRSNSIKLLTLFLNKLRNNNIDFGVVDIRAGDKTNAIPRESVVYISINSRLEQNVRELANEFLKEVKLEYSVSDPLIKYEFVRYSKVKNLKDKSKSGESGLVLSKSSAQTLINVLLVYPNGPLAFSSTIPGLVETSLNLATVSIINGVIQIQSSIRSSFNSAKLNVAQTVRSLFSLVPQSKVVISGDYPSWEPNGNSELVKKSEVVFKRLFNKEIRITAIHGGLETAIIGNIYPGIDMISIGPTTENAHSPDERVSISSVRPTYQFLLGMLDELSK